MKSRRHSKTSGSGPRGTRTRKPPALPEATITAFERRLDLRREREAKLLAAIRAGLPALEALLAEINDHWAYEDLVYRFYHQSYKIYRAQAEPMRVVAALRALLPEVALNEAFL